jgi:hypothetical protein
MEVSFSSETSAHFQRTTRRYIPEDRIFWNTSCATLRNGGHRAFLHATSVAKWRHRETTRPRSSASEWQRCWTSSQNTSSSPPPRFCFYIINFFFDLFSTTDTSAMGNGRGKILGRAVWALWRERPVICRPRRSYAPAFNLWVPYGLQISLQAALLTASTVFDIHLLNGLVPSSLNYRLLGNRRHSRGGGEDKSVWM